MNTFDKNMEKIFDVAPVEQKEQPLVPVSKPAVNESDLKQDLNFEKFTQYLKIDKTTEFNTLASKDKKRITKQINH